MGLAESTLVHTTTSPTAAITNKNNDDVVVRGAAVSSRGASNTGVKGRISHNNDNDNKSDIPNKRITSNSQLRIDPTSTKITGKSGDERRNLDYKRRSSDTINDNGSNGSYNKSNNVQARNHEKKIPILKGLVCGDSNVGKSCLLRRLRGEEVVIEEVDHNDKKQEQLRRKKLMALIPWSPSDIKHCDTTDDNGNIHRFQLDCYSNRKNQLHIIEYHNDEIKNNTKDSKGNNGDSIRKRKNHRNINTYNRQNVNFLIVMVDRTNRTTLEYAKDFIDSFLYSSNSSNISASSVGKGGNTTSEKKGRSDAGKIKHNNFSPSFPSICILLNHYDVYFKSKNDIPKKKEEGEEKVTSTGNTDDQSENCPEQTDLITMEEIKTMSDEIISKHQKYIQRLEQDKNDIDDNDTNPVESSISSSLSSSISSIKIQCFDACMKNGYGIQALNSFMLIPYLQQRERELMDELMKVRLSIQSLDSHGMYNNISSLKSNGRENVGNKSDENGATHVNDTTKEEEFNNYGWFTFEALEKQRLEKREMKLEQKKLQEVQNTNRAENINMTKSDRESDEIINSSEKTTKDSNSPIVEKGQIKDETINKKSRQRRNIIHPSLATDSKTATKERRYNDTSVEAEEDKKKSTVSKSSSQTRRKGRGRGVVVSDQKVTIKRPSPSEDYWKNKYEERKKMNKVKQVLDPKQALEAFLASDESDDEVNDTQQRNSQRKKNVFKTSRNSNVLDSDSESDSSSDSSFEPNITRKKNNELSSVTTIERIKDSIDMKYDKVTRPSNKEKQQKSLQREQEKSSSTNEVNEKIETESRHQCTFDGNERKSQTAKSIQQGRSISSPMKEAGKKSLKADKKTKAESQDHQLSDNIKVVKKSIVESSENKNENDDDQSDPSKEQNSSVRDDDGNEEVDSSQKCDTDQSSLEAESPVGNECVVGAVDDVKDTEVNPNSNSSRSNSPVVDESEVGAVDGMKNIENIVSGSGEDESKEEESESIDEQASDSYDQNEQEEQNGVEKLQIEQETDVTSEVNIKVDRKKDSDSDHEPETVDDSSKKDETDSTTNESNIKIDKQLVESNSFSRQERDLVTDKNVTRDISDNDDDEDDDDEFIITNTTSNRTTSVKSKRIDHEEERQYDEPNPFSRRERDLATNKHVTKQVYDNDDDDDDDDDEFVITNTTPNRTARAKPKRIKHEEMKQNDSITDKPNPPPPPSLNSDVMAALAAAQKEAEKRLTDVSSKKKKSKKKEGKKDKTKEAKPKKKKKHKQSSSS